MSDIFNLVAKDLDVDLMHDKEFMEKLNRLKQIEKTIAGLHEIADRLREEGTTTYQLY